MIRDVVDVFVCFRIILFSKLCMPQAYCNFKGIILLLNLILCFQNICYRKVNSQSDLVTRYALVTRLFCHSFLAIYTFFKVLLKLTRVTIDNVYGKGMKLNSIFGQHVSLYTLN